MAHPVLLETDDLQRLTFTITWSPKTQPATLSRLTYNDRPVALPQDISDKGAISVEFTAIPEGTHRFDWTLMFLGRTLKSLKASATIDGGGPLAVGDPRDEAKDRWSGTGLAKEGDQ